MESKNSNEAKFDSFLTKTIILSSKKYFKKQIDMSSKEQTILMMKVIVPLLRVFLSLTMELKMTMKESMYLCL